MKKSTKEAILEEATNLFYEFGYPKTSIRDITRKLKIKSPLIYYYFKDKENLLFEVIESIGLEVINGLEKVVNNIDEPLERFAQMIHMHISLNVKERKKIKIFIEEGYHLSGKFKERILFINRKIYNYYYYQLKMMGERGLLTNKEYSIMVLTILGSINWVYRWFREGGPLTIEEVATRTLQIFFSGILSEKERESFDSQSIK